MCFLLLAWLKAQVGAPRRAPGSSHRRLLAGNVPALAGADGQVWREAEMVWIDAVLLVGHACGQPHCGKGIAVGAATECLNWRRQATTGNGLLVRLLRLPCAAAALRSRGCGAAAALVTGCPHLPVALQVSGFTLVGQMPTPFHCPDGALRQTVPALRQGQARETSSLDWPGLSVRTDWRRRQTKQ